MSADATAAGTDSATGSRPVLDRIAKAALGVENGLLLAVFAAAVLLPLSEMVGRKLGGIHLPNSAAYLRASVLWLTFVGALIATREKGHISLSLAEILPKGPAKKWMSVGAHAVAAAVAALLASASFDVARADVGTGEPLLGFVPSWIVECVMPGSLVLIAVVMVWQAGETWLARGLAFGLAAAGLSIGFIPGATILAWPLVGIIMLATIAGAPVFVAMTGIALVLFFRDGTSIAGVSTEVFRLLGSSTLPAIPLLTGAGYVLAESRASVRLVRLLRAVLGSFRGGVSLSVLLLCALFTAFTGGSGVTILALGGLAVGILREDGQDEDFSLGLVTTSGSLGLLFPPSIPVILYSVVASVPADLLYIGGLVPGIVLVLVVAAWSMIKTRTRKAAGTPPPKLQAFSAKELGLAAKDAIWELTIPLVVIVLVFGGLSSMVEAAAAALAWTIIVECFITRDLHPTRDLPRVLRHAGILVGAVLLLLASALGFTGYLVDAQIPDAIVGFAQTHIHSKIIFLLFLNAVLLVLGSVFEIYAAIVVLAPIVAPLGVAFGINPIHLGVLFLANLELGFILPPAGLNLFLSSSRFGVPLTRLYRIVIPFLLFSAVGVLLITYLDPMTLGVLHLLGKDTP